MRRVNIIVLLLLSHLSSHAQVSINFAWYDKHTFELYQNKDWDRLIELGHKAINSGYDYYYLRMRMGIAFYEQKEYRSAITHFEKAMTFNNSDPLTVEYLYYSYKLSGRNMDANLVYARHKKQLIARNVTSPMGVVSGLYTEGGLKMLSPSNPEFGSLKYVHVGIQQQLGSRLNLYHGYMRLSQNIYQEASAASFGFGPSQPSQGETKLRYAQNEYFLKATLPITKGIQLKASIHTQAITDSIQYNNFAYWVAINTSIKLLDLYIAYGGANINNVSQQQFTSGITIYPAKNQNFYLQTAITYHLDDKISNIIFYQKVGLRTGAKTWFEFYGSFGNMKNVQELDGFYIYNLNNNLNRRLGVSSIFLLNKNVKLFLGYTAETFEELDTELPYKQHYIFTGLSVLIKTK